MYRKCAAAVVLRSDGQSLVLSRADRPSAWQFPQGGFEEKESLTAAALRELWEETGIPPWCARPLAAFLPDGQCVPMAQSSNQKDGRNSGGKTTAQHNDGNDGCDYDASEFQAAMRADGAVSIGEERVFRYDVPPGTWLERQGFAGQELHFAVFQLVRRNPPALAPE